MEIGRLFCCTLYLRKNNGFILFSTSFAQSRYHNFITVVSFRALQEFYIFCYVLFILLSWKVFIVYLVNFCVKQAYTVLTNFKKGLIMYKFLSRKLKLKRGLKNYIIYFSSTHSNNAIYNKWAYLYFKWINGCGLTYFQLSYC